MLPNIFTLALAGSAPTQRPDASTASSLNCSRAALHEAVDRYIAAQSTGKTEWLQKLMWPDATYLENYKTVAIDNSTMRRSLKIDFTHSIYDTTQCAAFTELVASSPADPWVIGAQIRLSEDKITKIDRVATTTGDWLFNATHTLHYSLLEDWGHIPEAQRDSRAALQAAADSYFDAMHNGSVIGANTSPSKWYGR